MGPLILLCLYCVIVESIKNLMMEVRLIHGMVKAAISSITCRSVGSEFTKKMLHCRLGSWANSIAISSLSSKESRSTSLPKLPLLLALMLMTVPLLVITLVVLLR
jgi:hypothetical protein